MPIREDSCTGSQRGSQHALGINVHCPGPVQAKGSDEPPSPPQPPVPPHPAQPPLPPSPAPPAVYPPNPPAAPPVPPPPAAPALPAVPPVPALPAPASVLNPGSVTPPQPQSATNRPARTEL